MTKSIQTLNELLDVAGKRQLVDRIYFRCFVAGKMTRQEYARKSLGVRMDNRKLNQEVRKINLFLKG